MKAFDEATGAAVAFLPEFQGLECSFEFSDAGSIGFGYYPGGANFSALMANRVEVGVYKDGVEMDDARFTMLVKEYDEVRTEEVVQFTGVSLINRLKKALVYSGDGSVSIGLDQVFTTATPGGILKALFDQNFARGSSTVMRSITYASFNAVTDSNGNAWAFTIPGPLTYTVGVNYLDVIRHLVNSGTIEVRMVGRDLRVYNPGTMGIDRTVLSTPVIFRRGREIAESPRRETREGIGAVVLISGDNALLRQEVDTSVEAAFGRDEIFVSQGGISDSTTLGILGQQEIDRSSEIRREITHKIIPEASPWKPYDDYKVSDYVYSDRGAGPERLRLRQMVISMDPVEATSASIVLNDKFLEREIVTARKIDGILGGATATGSVAVPTDPAITDNTTPKAPTSLSSTSSLYVNGITEKTVTAVALAWPAVTQNTDNSTLTDLDHYETQWKSDEIFTNHPALTLNPGRDLESYTKRFDRRGKGYGWLGGDSGSSTRATSGKDFWAFADTNLGTADQAGRIQEGTWGFPHNTWVLTDDADSSVFDAKWGYGNRMTANDAFLQTTVGNWVSVTNCTVVRGTTTGYYGTSNCLQITSVAPGDVTASMAAAGALYMPVVAGKTYSVSMRGRSVGTVRQVALGIRWYDASNALLSTNTSSNMTGSNSAWVRYVHTGVAPANAVKASMVVIFRAAATAQVFNADVLMLSEGNANYYGWNDPGRAFLGGVCAVLHPEELGGTPLTDFADIFWVDACTTVSGKILVAYTRYSPLGVFKNAVYIAQYDGTTHFFESITAWSTSDTFNWWTAVVADATYLYAYGVDNSGGAGSKVIHVSRVPIGNVLAGTKEYWNGTSWTTTRASSAGIYTGYSAQFGGVTIIGSTFYAVITEYGGNTMKYLTAPAAQGTWTMQGSFYTQPEMGSGLIAYFPRIHRQLESNAGIPMSYSVNGVVAGDDSLDNIRYYAPKFLIGPPANIVPVEPAGDWSESRIIPNGVLIDNIGSIPPGSNFRARVRAADSNGHFSTWTLSTALRTSLDTVAPNKPSTPIVSAWFQGLRIEWDGMDFQGGPPPGDFSYLEVHVSEVNNFQPGPLTKVDTIRTRSGGVFPYQGLVYGRTYYVRFIAVDGKANRSDPSDTASATPTQLVNTLELANKLIAGASIADNAIAVRSLTVAAFENSIVPNGGMEEELTNANGTGQGQPYGWVDSGWFWGASGVRTYESATPLGGARSLKVTMAAATDGVIVRSIKFPVVEGKLIAIQAKYKTSRAIATTNVIQIQLATGVSEPDAGSFPGANSTWSNATTQAGTGAVQTIEAKAIVPAGHKYATVHLISYQAADGSGYNVIWDDVFARPVGGSAFIADLSVLNGAIANLAVDNAKIANVSVGKLTAGSLTADMTVSARIKTADTGARVELNSSGLQAYNSAGTQTVDIASASGDVLMTGRFRTGITGARLEMTDTTDRTTIWFYPTTGTNVAFINSPTDANGAPRWGVNSGQFTYNGTMSRHLLFLDNEFGIYLRTYRTVDQSPNGTELFLGETSANLGFNGASGSAAGGSVTVADDSVDIRQITTAVSRGGRMYIDGTSLWHQVYATSSNINVEIQHDDDGTIYYHRGRFPNFTDLGNEQAIFCGKTSIASGTSWAIGYGTAKVATPSVIATPRLNTAIGGALIAQTTSSFTYSTTNTGAGDINFWVFRTN